MSNERECVWCDEKPLVGDHGVRFGCGCILVTSVIGLHHARERWYLIQRMLLEAVDFEAAIDDVVVVAEHALGSFRDTFANGTSEMRKRLFGRRSPEAPQ